MASNALVAVGATLLAGGLGLVVAAPRLSPKQPVVSPDTLGEELGTRLRDTATRLQVRAETLAGLESLRASVSTDAETVRKQTQDEINFQPKAGEEITIAQVDPQGTPSVLLVLPSEASAASGLSTQGLHLTVAGERARLVEVVPVTPKYPDPDRPLRGALAITWPVDLQPFVQRLDALKVGARLEIDGKPLQLGRAIGADELTVPVPIAGDAGRGAKLMAAIPMQTSGPPLMPLGLGAAFLGAIVGLAGLGRPRAAASTADTIAQGRAASATEIAVGSVIDATYEVTSLLGKGGMGAVWQARHLRLPDKRVAVKFLLNEANNAELLARFRREAEVTSKLGHPNIVGVMDFNTLPSGTPYIVLEYLEGESLARRIARGPLPLDEALGLARQIGSALHAAHKAGIVHRDLKPENIYLVPSESGAPQVKVLDFGISKMRGNVSVQTQESTILGTPQYMSPEQANGKNSEVDARSDIWALGAIVHEMLTGQAAFAGDSMTTLLVAVLVNPSPSLRGQPGVPDHVAEALERALAKEPGERHADIPSFIAALTGVPLVTQLRPVVDG